MVPKEKRDVLKPQYYDRFRCIMAACEDNCCQNWDITIDKNTYNKYRNIKDSKFRKKQEASMKRVRGEKASDFSYAKFVLSERGNCPFQTDEGLCEIHRDLGEEFLCETCKTYPRLTRNMSSEYLELSITMSCPEAVRVALFNENIMEFSAEKTEFKRNDPLIRSWFKPMEGEEKTQYIEHGWSMREAAISIMQIRTCPVAHRLIIIAMMLNDAVDLHDGNKADEIPSVLDFYSGGTYGSKFMDEFGDIGPNEKIELQMSSLLYYIIRGTPDRRSYPAFTGLMERFDRHKESLGGFFNQIDNATMYYAFIKQATDAHWGSFLAQWEHVLENYLVNFMFAEIFPLRFHDKGLNPYHHSLILAEQYAILRMLLCGNYDPEEGFSKQYITKTISQVAQMNQHSPKPLEIAENYKTIGIDGPAHLYYLLL